MNILHTYFDNKLVEAGFPSELTIESSLSYSQGDGVAFYGRLYSDDWINLYKHIYPEQTEKANRRFAFIAEYIGANEYFNVLDITRNHFGYRYSHCNTMSLDACPAVEAFCFRDIRNKDKEMFREIWDSFIVDLAEYIKATSMILERLGYRLLESMYIEPEEKRRTINTKQYLIEFTVEPVPFHYGYFSSEDFGYEDTNQFCEAILSGMKIVDLSATVYHKALGIQMGESSLGWCTYLNEDTTYGGHRRYLILDAIREARIFSQKMKDLTQLRQAQ
ncbi:hypothetical protein ACLSYN_07225 [Avibacterium avium]|uniref:hypothetical protein n=1 Tax=Avibacterium avium TaxID=751 RepID=UPI003BF775A6